jgi:hypothetical protein
VLIVEEDGEYRTGDRSAKMAHWLFEEPGQQGRCFRTGQFRLLAEREGESSMIVVGKGTIKRMGYQDVDKRSSRSRAPQRSAAGSPFPARSWGTTLAAGCPARKAAVICSMMGAMWWKKCW